MARGITFRLRLPPVVHRLRTGAGGLRRGLLADGMRLAPFLEAGLLPGEGPQVIQLLPADVRTPHDFDLVHARGVEQEGALDADPVRADAADRVRLVDPATAATDRDALEDLDALARPFDDLHTGANC